MRFKTLFIFCITIWVSDACDVTQITLPPGCTIQGYSTQSNAFTLVCAPTSNPTTASSPLCPITTTTTTQLYATCAPNNKLKKNLVLFNLQGKVINAWVPSNCSTISIQSTNILVNYYDTKGNSQTMTIPLNQNMQNYIPVQLIIFNTSGTLNFLYVPQECDGSSSTFANNLLTLSCFNKQTSTWKTNILPLSFNEAAHGAGSLTGNNAFLYENGTFVKVHIPSGCTAKSYAFKPSSTHISCAGPNNTVVDNLLPISIDNFSNQNYTFLNNNGALVYLTYPSTCDHNNIQYNNGVFTFFCQDSTNTNKNYTFQHNLIQDGQITANNTCAIQMVSDTLTSPCNLAALKNKLPQTCLVDDAEIINGTLHVVCFDNTNTPVPSTVFVPCDCNGNLLSSAEKNPFIVTNGELSYKP